MIVQLPEASATAVPSTVVPLVSNSVTVAPASAPLPVTVGVVSLVMLSVFEVPLSDAAIRSGALGAAATVSTVTDERRRCHAGVAGNVGLLRRQAMDAIDSGELVIVQLPEASATAVPSTVVPLVSNSVTVAPASAPLPLTVGVVSLVMLSVFVTVDRLVRRRHQVRRARRRRHRVDA